jgi:hypothetical protein
VLQDYDTIDDASESTSLLLDTGHAGKKTRAIAARLETIAFTTTLYERAFDHHVRRRPHEPAVALAGFDHPLPRRALEAPQFECAVCRTQS